MQGVPVGAVKARLVRAAFTRLADSNFLIVMRAAMSYENFHDLTQNIDAHPVKYHVNCNYLTNIVQFSIDMCSKSLQALALIFIHPSSLSTTLS